MPGPGGASAPNYGAGGAVMVIIFMMANLKKPPFSTNMAENYRFSWNQPGATKNLPEEKIRLKIKSLLTSPCFFFQLRCVRVNFF